LTHIQQVHGAAGALHSDGFEV